MQLLAYFKLIVSKTENNPALYTTRNTWDSILDCCMPSLKTVASSISATRHIINQRL